QEQPLGSDWNGVGRAVCGPDRRGTQCCVLRRWLRVHREGPRGKDSAALLGDLRVVAGFPNVCSGIRIELRVRDPVAVSVELAGVLSAGAWAWTGGFRRGVFDPMDSFDDSRSGERTSRRCAGDGYRERALCGGECDDRASLKILARKDFGQTTLERGFPRAVHSVDGVAEFSEPSAREIWGVRPTTDRRDVALYLLAAGVARRKCGGRGSDPKSPRGFTGRGRAARL